MKCSKAARQLQAYLDNELSASQEKRLEHHLRGCALCRLELTAVKKTSEVMDSLHDIEPHKDLVSPVMKILRHEQEAPSKLQQFLEMIIQNKRRILAVGANLTILLLLALKVPTLINRSLPNNRAGVIPSTIPMSAIEYEPLKSAIKPEYDPVDMAAYINDIVDKYNLSPVEKDMIVDNFFHDANDFIEANLQPSSGRSAIRVRSVRMIYTYDSKGKPLRQRVIFIQRTNYEKTK